MDNISLTQLAELLIISPNSLSLLPPLYARYFSYVPLTLVGIVVAICLTPWIGYFARRFNILNDTKKVSRNRLNRHENQERRINPNQVPLLGGLAVIIPFLFATPLLTGFNEMSVPLLLALGIIALAGTLDDIYNLPPAYQFIAQFVSASIMALSILNFDTLTIPFITQLDLSSAIWESNILGIPLEFVFPGDFLLILWIVICINAMKWTGGIDALIETHSIVISMLLFIIAMRSPETLFSEISIALLIGLLIGFTFFNAPPAKIFSGSAGKGGYGFLIGVFAVLSGARQVTALLILLIPLMDFIFVIYKRISTNRPNSLKEIVKLPAVAMRSDTNHLHHKLLQLNLSVKQILALEILLSITIGIIALSIAEAFRLGIAMSAVLIIGGFLLLLDIRASKSQRKKIELKKEESPESRYSY